MPDSSAPQKKKHAMLSTIYLSKIRKTEEKIFIVWQNSIDYENEKT